MSVMVNHLLERGGGTHLGNDIHTGRGLWKGVGDRKGRAVVSYRERGSVQSEGGKGEQVKEVKKELGTKIEGNISLIFQPNEERRNLETTQGVN